jgi:flavin-dependent dehydrogenase
LGILLPYGGHVFQPPVHCPGFIDSITGPTRTFDAKIGVTTGKNADQFLQSFLDSPMIRGLIKTNKPTVNVDLIPIKPMRKSFTERVLVVGEAAGQVKSTTCGGIF